jgi:transketolase
MAYQLRCDVVEMVHQGGSGHPGGSFSSAEIVATLYWHVMHVDPTNPRWEERDRFILSKGHSAPILYAALGEKGYFDTAHFSKLRVIDSILQGHPDMNKTPGVDMTTGSLGQGLAAGLGMALAGRRLERDYTVYVLLSDGEVQEGMVWETAMAAAHFKAHRLTAIVDVNHLQTDGPTETIMTIEPLADKWRAFGWHVQTVDGHDVAALMDAFDERGTDGAGKPRVLLCDTIKGKGVSYMEKVTEWHSHAIDDAQREIALRELQAHQAAALGSTSA